LKKRNRKK